MLLVQRNHLNWIQNPSNEIVKPVQMRNYLSFESPPFYLHKLAGYFTFSLAARGSEDKRTSARGLFFKANYANYALLLANHCMSPWQPSRLQWTTYINKQSLSLMVSRLLRYALFPPDFQSKRQSREAISGYWCSGLWDGKRQNYKIKLPFRIIYILVSGLK